MKKKVFFLFVVSFWGCASLPETHDSHLVYFNSDESMLRLSRSQAKRDFFTLANHFESQSNALFCGPTSATIVLNSLRSAGSKRLPKDNSRLRQEFSQYLPASVDLTVARYTQETVIRKSPKAIDLVFGREFRYDGKLSRDPGYQIREFNELLKAFGLATTLRIANTALTDAEMIDEIISNVKNSEDFVVVNYSRSSVGQHGGGHLSPVGAYDEKSRSFLILDVNPSRALWVWMPADLLIKGMRSFDRQENRGYIMISDI